MLLCSFISDSILLDKATDSRTVFNQVSRSNKAMPPMNTDQRPLLVTLSARAMSSVGVALSILAIWLAWLVPSLKPDVPDPRIIPAAKSRRSSVINPLQRTPASRRLSTPAVPHTSMFSPPESYSPTRHVSFVDSQTTPTRDLVPPARIYDEPDELVPQLLPEPDADVSPQSSVSSSATLVSTPPVLTRSLPSHSLDTCDESIAESDSSRRSSIPSILHIPRMKKALLNKGQKSSAASEPEISRSTSSTPPLPDELVKPVRRTSVGFAPWSISRGRATLDTTSEVASIKSCSSSRISFGRRPSSRSGSNFTSPVSAASSSSSTSTMSSSSYFIRKADRRRSTPVPRTQPYAYPYYAAMPTSSSVDPSYTSYLRGLPQFEVEMNSAPAQSPEPDEQKNGLEQPRGRDPRLSSVPAHITLGHSHRPVPKRRSASESWAQRPAQRL